ncbi:MAG TPA: COG1361 S-layer family protein [Methanosarcina sp.]|nr:COG1361 S-layer family protein [Methanosarcina sp.]
MKKISLLILLLMFSSVILLLGAGTALSASGLIDSSSIQANVTNQNPDAARPGEPVELTVSVQNVGNDNLKDIIVTIEPQYPFSKVSGETLEKKVSYLNARQDNGDAAVLKFKLMTDSNASEGTYDVNIVTTARKDGASSNTFTTTKTIHVEVRGKEYAQIVTINKANIDIAKEESLEFIITNTGSSPLKNMVVSWKDPKGVILPVYSDNTKYIKYLEPGQSVTVAYSVMADVNANPGLYTLDINLSFEDYESSTKNIQTTAGLFVGGETDFDVSFSESSAGEISLSVANVGNNMAYAVKVSVPEQKNYKATGSSSTIVGNLEKGDYTIASFNVASTQTEGENSGTQSGTAKARAAVGDNASSTSMATDPLKVQIEYTDAKGERITVDRDVAVQMSASTGTGTGSRSGTSSSSGLSSYLVYIVIIVLAGAGIFIYNKKKQIRNEERKPRNKIPEDQKDSSGVIKN